jgi:hypothetical protein
MGKTLHQTEPTRKQRFNAALELAGITAKEWAATYSDFGYEHLYRVLTGERDGSEAYNETIDRFIAKYLPSQAA